MGAQSAEKNFDKGGQRYGSCRQINRDFSLIVSLMISSIIDELVSCGDYFVSARGAGRFCFQKEKVVLPRSR